MLSRLLRRAGNLALTRPVPLLLATVLPFLGLGLYALTVPVDLTFTGIMDRSHPEVARYFAAVREQDLGGTLLLLLEGPEEELPEAVDALMPVLEGHDGVRWVAGSPPTAWLRERAPWLVDREVFEAWLRLASQPEDQDNARWLAARLEEYRSEEVQPDGARVLQIKLWDDPLDLAVGGDLFFDLEERAREVLAGSGVQGSFSGLPAIAAQDQSRTLATIQRLSPLSLLLVLVLFRGIERRWWGLLAVVIPMLLAVAASLGAVGLLTHTLTVMEIFFGVTVFGLGIDFAVHLMTRHREELARGVGFDEALLKTLAGTGRGVIAGAVTTAGAFFIAATAPDPAAVHLGLSGGFGLLFCLILMLTILPCFWVLLERRRPLETVPARVPRSLALVTAAVPALARHATRHPLLHVAAALGIVAFAVAGVPRFKAETDLQKIFNREVPALETVHRVQELFHLNGAPWIAVVEDLEEARELTRRFEAHPLFARAESAATLFPADLEERRARLDDQAPTLRSRIALASTLRALAQPEQAQDLDRYLEALQVLDRARTVGPPTVDDLPPALARKLITPRGHYLVLAYSRRPTMDGAQAREERLAAQAIHPGATALGALLEAIMINERPWVWSVLFLILGFVALVLMVDFRRTRLAVLALVPVLLGTTVTFGFLCWAGVGFNVMMMLVVPLIIGLGVDDGIHVVHRIQEDASLPLDRAAASVGRAIVMTTATTCSSFAILLFTDHPGLESMALVMLIGLPLCLLASVSTLPAVAMLTATPSALSGHGPE